jgi:hypothetical protein
MNSQTPSDAVNHHQIHVRHDDYFYKTNDDKEVSDISTTNIIIDMVNQVIAEVKFNDLTVYDCHTMECLQ